MAAFRPFARFTPPATKIFVETTRERLEDLDTHTAEEIRKLNAKKEVKDDIWRYDELWRGGDVTDREREESHPSPTIPAIC